MCCVLCPSDAPMALTMGRSLLRKALTLVLNSGSEPALRSANGMYALLLPGLVRTERSPFFPHSCPPNQQLS